jgi:hypothetical protein
MAIRSLHGLSANFTLTPPLFKPPRYGPERGQEAGINYFADLRMTFRQNFFLQDWFRNKFGVELG